MLLFPVEDGEVFDFRGMRLDWFRLQVSTHPFLKHKCSFSAVVPRTAETVFAVYVFKYIFWVVLLDNECLCNLTDHEEFTITFISIFSFMFSSHLLLCVFLSVGLHQRL